MGELFKHSVVNVNNDDRDITTVEVLDLDVDGDEAALPLLELVEQLQTALGSIPEEFRGSAVMRIKAYGDYASADAHIEFTRPETDAELADRKRWLNSLEQDNEARDRREFERLNRKFNNPVSTE